MPHRLCAVNRIRQVAPTSMYYVVPLWALRSQDPKRYLKMGS